MMLRYVQILAVLALLLLAACGDGGNEPAPVRPVSSGILPAVASLDALAAGDGRLASGVASHGIDVTAPVGSAHGEAGADVWNLIPPSSTPPDHSWVLYRVTAPPSTLTPLALTAQGADGLWMLVADYSTGRWSEARPMVATATTVDLAALGNCISPGGNIFCAFILAATPGGEAVQLSSLALEQDLPSSGVFAFQDGTWKDDSQPSAIGLYDFATGRFEVTWNGFTDPDTNVRKPLNPVISPDGTKLAFYAFVTFDTGLEEWHWFTIPLAGIDSQYAKNVTIIKDKGNLRWQDPSFLTDDFLIGKETASSIVPRLLITDLNGNTKARFKSEDGLELSKPIHRKLGDKDVIVCWRGTDTDADLVYFEINLDDIAGGMDTEPQNAPLITVPGAAEPGVGEYYPAAVPYDDSLVVFTQPSSTIPRHDKLASFDLDQPGVINIAGLNLPGRENTDAGPIGKGWLFYSLSVDSIRRDIYFGHFDGVEGSSTKLAVPPYDGAMGILLGSCYSASSSLPAKPQP